MASIRKAFYYQLVITVNDNLFLLNEVVALIFYGIAKTKPLPYPLIWFKNCINVPLFNMYYTVAPFLVLNICIERNIAVYRPFNFYMNEFQRKRWLITLCIFEYFLSFGVNFYEVLGFYDAVGCPDGNSTCREMVIAEYVVQNVAPVCTSVIAFTMAICLVAILILNCTFLIKYYTHRQGKFRDENTKEEHSPSCFTSILSEYKILATMLIVQTVIVISSQVCMFIKFFVQNGTPFTSYNDHNCIVFKLQMAEQVLYYLGPSSNLFVYSVVSKEFRQFYFAMIIQCGTAIRNFTKKSDRAVVVVSSKIKVLQL